MLRKLAPLTAALALAGAALVAAGCDGKDISDAPAAGDAGAGAVERPPVLPRPPGKGLPAELRPPR